MASVSLCMIVKNEEEALERCLGSVAGVVDEIVVVDTGSSDRTKEIAAKFTEKIYDFPWIDDFAAARNFAFSKGTGDYLMWLDADDVVRESERKKLLLLKERLETDPVDVVMMRYTIAFDEKGNSTFSFYRERLVKRCRAALWVGRIHEVIVPFGHIVKEDIRIEHRKLKPSDPDRNLRIFERMLEEGEPFGARELYYYGKELYYHKRYQEAAEVLGRYLELPDGWVEDRLDACRHISYCFSELSENRKALWALLRGLEFRVPRAELCCDLGGWFFREKRYEEAVFWYRQALKDKEKADGNGFIQEDCHGYLPCLQLCVCYDKLGKFRLAERYNTLAEKYKPGTAACEFNRNYFESKRQE